MRCINHNFVGLDVVGEKEPGKPEKEIDEQNEQANGRQSLYFEEAQSRGNSFDPLGCSELSSLGELVDEQAER